MSCNCSSNPCSCPNANCSCPANFSINPATIACPNGSQCTDTMYATCVFTNQYLTCSAQPAGTDLNTVLQAMDAKICACGSCSGQTQVSPGLTGMSDYYVDSSNSVLGDGSVINPFQTMEQAYNKIIGTGTVASPQRPDVTVHVAEGVGYTTALNIYIPTIKWIFYPSQFNVTYTGSGTYFIDSNAVTGAASLFAVYGHLNFITSTGAFLRNTHSYYNGDKTIYCEANSLVGNTNSTGLPFIANYQTNTVSAGQGVADTILKLSTSSSIIISATNTLASITGGRFKLDLNGGRAWYGYNTASALAAGVSGGNVLFYNNTDSDVSNYLVSTTIQNGSITSLNATSMISMSGNFSYFLIDNINVGSVFNSNKPDTFLNIGTVTQVQTAATAYEFTFLMKDCILDPNAFAVTAPVTPVIEYSGAGQVLDYFQMQNNILYEGLVIDTQIRLGLIAQGLLPVSCRNIINGDINFTQLPTSSSGLVSGSLWSNGGVITIA